MTDLFLIVYFAVCYVLVRGVGMLIEGEGK
jgi:hypothetical protein